MLISFVIVAGLLAPLASCEKLTSLPTHLLKAPFIEEKLENRYWNFGGDTQVDVQKHVRLTPDRKSRVGWLWSKELLKAENWLIEFEFHVGVDPMRTLYADGFAFWYTTEKEQTGSVFGNKNGFTGLGVFFDSYNNRGNRKEDFPAIMGMIGDGKTMYNKSTDGYDEVAAKCFTNYHFDGKPGKARVKYIKGKVLLFQNFYAARNSNGTWLDCFAIPNAVLPPQGYIGFTAETGDISDRHDILGATTYELTELGNISDAEMKQLIDRANSYAIVRSSDGKMGDKVFRQQEWVSSKDRVPNPAPKQPSQHSIPASGRYEQLIMAIKAFLLFFFLGIFAYLAYVGARTSMRKTPKNRF